MEVSEITNLITSVGFPILMCILFFKWFTEDYKKEQEQTREVITELKESINAITQMADIFSKYIEKKDVKDE